MTRVLKRQVHTIGRRRAWVIWSVALAAYILAVFHRTSLGVAGLLAAERFGITATALSVFTVVQLAVYAALQVPIGVALDRYGPRRLILTGLVLMTAGQAWFAIAGTFAAGLTARVLLGMGDAMIFISLMRLVAVWFRVKQAPVITQVTGVLGQFGALGAALPLTAALKTYGWTHTFATMAALGLGILIAVLAFVRNSPYTGESVEQLKLRALARTMRTIWLNPGTRLGMYSHFTTMFSAAVFGLLWGYPFLVIGQGLTPNAAASLMMVMTATSVIVGPLTGRAVVRFPFHRSQIVMGIVAVIALVWAVVLALPSRAPLWLLVVLVVVTASGGPVSMVSFDLARTFHRPQHLGRATGVVNMGGFVATLAAIGLIGLVLDLLEPRGPAAYDLNDFRIAMSVQFLLWGFGGIQVWRYRHKAIDHVEEVAPGSVQRLRSGESLLPGISTDHEP